MRKFFHCGFYFFIALLMTSCATIPAPSTQTNQKMAWNQREQSLTQIKNWDLRGAVAIRSANQNITASMQWQQHQNNYTILLFGPFGAGSAKLTGSPQHIQLATADGKITQASTPEQLLSQQLGWNLPISDLYYWIRSLPVPNVPSKKQFDSYNRLIAMNQSGWVIQYQGYTSVNQMDVPNKIVMSYPRLDVKIVIKQWQLY